MQNAKKQYRKTSAVILAAGNSSRMGSPKFMLRFNEKYTFLEKIVEGYTNFGCNEVVVVLNPKGAEILKNSNSKFADFMQIVINPYPEKERLLSIQIGLKALNKIERVFIHPVDNPFVNCDILQLMLKNSNSGDYQIPFYQGKGGHPILISKKIFFEICNSEDINLNFKIFLKSFIHCRVVVNDRNILSNINRLDDYLNFGKNQLK